MCTHNMFLWRIKKNVYMEKYLPVPAVRKMFTWIALLCISILVDYFEKDFFLLNTSHESSILLIGNSLPLSHEMIHWKCQALFSH